MAMDFAQDTVVNRLSKDEPALDIYAQANQLLDLTKTMLAAAKSDDWDEFELQEQQRSAMLKMIFGSRTAEESARLQLADVVKEIQLIDQAICNLITQRRDQAAEELRHLRHAREGDKVYRIAADDGLVTT
jgi:hypothetical protein